MSADGHEMTMRRYRTVWAARWVLAALATPALAETTVPRDLPPEICDLSVVADPTGSDATLTWSGGTPPFMVVRSESEDFSADEYLEVLALAVPSRQFVDRGVVASDGRLFYQVFDANSQPQIFRFTPNAGLPGSQVQVRGVGFPSDCNQITVLVGGAEVPTKLDCSFTGFTFEVPTDSVTGYLMVATPAGATVAGSPYQGEYCKGQLQPPRSW